MAYETFLIYDDGDLDRGMIEMDPVRLAFVLGRVPSRSTLRLYRAAVCAPSAPAVGGRTLDTSGIDDLGVQTCWPAGGEIRGGVHVRSTA
jgi:hypothetical protein